MSKPPDADRVAILGPGLLGGSLALALASRATVRIWGRRAAAVDAVKNHCPLAFASTDLAAVVADANIVILCTPIGAMAEIARRILADLKPDAIVTDVGSVKAPVVVRLESELGSRFVGSHPMAGSDRSGIEFARADLFNRAACIVTPTPRTDPAALGRIRDFWTALGCTLFELDPEAHDRAMALVSHLPHLTAAALVRAAARINSGALDLAGPGFLDSTRVAMGPADMWDEILRENRAAVLAAIRALLSELDDVQNALSQEQGLNAFLTDARETRLRLRRQ